MRLVYLDDPFPPQHFCRIVFVTITSFIVQKYHILRTFGVPAKLRRLSIRHIGNMNLEEKDKKRKHNYNSQGSMFRNLECIRMATGGKDLITTGCIKMSQIEFYLIRKSKILRILFVTIGELGDCWYI